MGNCAPGKGRGGRYVGYNTQGHKLSHTHTYGVCAACPGVAGDAGLKLWLLGHTGAGCLLSCRMTPSIEQAWRGASRQIACGTLRQSVPLSAWMMPEVGWSGKGHWACEHGNAACVVLCTWCARALQGRPTKWVQDIYMGGLLTWRALHVTWRACVTPAQAVPTVMRCCAARV